MLKRELQYDYVWYKRLFLNWWHIEEKRIKQNSNSTKEKYIITEVETSMDILNNG